LGFEEGNSVLPDDDAALARAARTDARSFAPLYQRYLRPVHGYCYRRLGDIEAAEDAASTIFVRALAQIATFRGDGTFRSWLFAIAFRTLNELGRRRLPTPLSDDLADELTDPDPSPLDRVIAWDEAAALRKAVDQLPALQREIVLLRLAGLTTEEIGAALGKRNDAVRAAHSRAVQQLRRVITHDEEVAHGA
jgi:RNA polymerase sigma-70 factor (ECF subfamily)